ncbi:Ran GAP Rna1 [Blastocladiella emersonii ATCC 22665]|nr:Ran GAP Rna1 [Blastocladiella emersonii ATCC 22665]
MTSTTFDISGKGLKFDTASDVAPYAAQLAAQADVEVINLSGNTFGVDAAKALSAAMAGKQKLRICNFSDMFTGRLKSEIPDCLTALTEVLIPLNVHTLDLSDNAFGPAGANPLVPFLSQTRSLHTLRLNNNGLGIQGGTTIAAALMAQAERNQREGLASPLRVFVAGRNRLENGSMEKLAAAFQAHGLLEHVQMPQNGIRPEGISHMVTALMRCPNLHTLDLQDNTFTKVGSRALALALPAWPKLRVLHLGDSLLSAAGARAVLKALIDAKAFGLERLHLAFNEMDARGAELVADYLLAANGAKLTLLELNGNCFDGEGAEVDRIKEVLAKFGKEDILDELDEMEELDSDEEAEAEDSEDEVEDDGAADELTAKLSKMGI